MMWTCHCMHCDDFFESDKKNATVCPSCKKKQVIEANKRAQQRKRLRAKGWDRLSDNMVAIRLKANEAFAAGLSYGQFHKNELIQKERERKGNVKKQV